MVEVTQFCMECSQTDNFQMTKGEIIQYFEDCNIHPPVSFDGVIDLPPTEECTACEMLFMDSEIEEWWGEPYL